MMVQRCLAILGTAVLLASAAACSGADEEDGPPIIDPGGPGDEPEEVSMEDIEDSLDVSHNEADVEFMHLMMAHHGQAIEMVELVEDRFENPDIDAISARMAVGQEGEISLMESWLQLNVYEPAQENPAHQNYCGLDIEGSHHGGSEDCVEIEYDHEGMEGMLSPDQMQELEDASGTEFDELFVEYMVMHHEGAITMAEEVIREGEHPVVYDMASSMAIEQGVEIQRMQDIIEGGGDGEDADG